MKQLILSLALLITTTLTFGQTLPKKISEEDFTIGESVQIESIILDETRKLNIYLPLNYSQDSLKKYPVIYLLDGSKDEDIIHISGLVQFGSFSWINRNPETIVVGIANVDRKRDFTFPSKEKIDLEEFPTSGKSESFINFIEKELQPFVDSNYRTTSTKTIIGQSLGGLLATEILFKKPALFDNYIIVSPSLWWSGEELLEGKLPVFKPDQSIYIAVGKEGELMERPAKELYLKLKENKKETVHLYYEFLEDKSHGDALHIAVYNAFGKIFKPTEK